MNKDDMYIAACLPVAKFPVQPADLSPCIIKQCPKCKQDMWASAKKRKLVKKYNWVLMCYDCAVLTAADEGVTPDEIKLVDIDKVL